MKFTIEMIDKEDCTTTKGKDIHIEEKQIKFLLYKIIKYYLFLKSKITRNWN